jgi:hypothetical protein
MMFRRMTPQERTELMYISRLQRLNCYPQIVRRLTEGQSAQSVARWLVSLHIDDPAGRWSQMYWCKLLVPLVKQVKTAKEELLRAERRKTSLPKKPEADSVVQKVEALTEEMMLLERIPESARQVWKHVDATLKKLNSEQILKFAFFQQTERLQRVMEMEKGMKMPLPWGHKEVQTLTQIGEAIRKLEVGEEWMRGKGGGMPCGGPYPGGLLPHSQTAEESELARKFGEFDEVDRNLMREATVRFVEMVQEGSRGGFKVGNLAVDAGSANRPETQVEKRTVTPEV